MVAYSVVYTWFVSNTFKNKNASVVSPNFLYYLTIFHVSTMYLYGCLSALSVPWLGEMVRILTFHMLTISFTVLLGSCWLFII
jgi:hypothetical protein